MRVLLLADLHANSPALAAIQEPYDLCICLGDLVDYGPDPVTVVDWVRANAAHVIRGNHDHGVAQRVAATGDTGFRYLAAVTRPLMSQMISEEQRLYLARLPLTRRLRLDGKVFHLVHATPRDPMDEYLFQDKSAWQRRIERLEADFVCVGHTHHQFQMDVGGTLVVNPGSVGQPRDGDPRAAYAIIEDGKVEFKRVEYPIEQTIALFNQLDLPDRAKEYTASVLRHGGWTADADALAEHASNGVSTLPPSETPEAVA